MNLRTRTLLIIILTLAFLMVTIYGAVSTILTRSFERLEQDLIKQNVERVQNAIADELASMSGTNADWAHWDDTVAFIQGEYDEYVEDNLYANALASIMLNFMLFVDSSGQPFYTTAVDLDTWEEVELPGDVVNLLTAVSPLTVHVDEESNIQGIVQTQQGLLLVTSRPILTSLKGGPIEGSLIMGRYLDENQVQHLSDSLRLSIDLYAFDTTLLPEDIQNAKAILETSSGIATQVLSSQTIVGYTTISDLYGNPALLLSVDMARDVYNQGQATLDYLIVAIAVVGAVFGVVVLVLLQRSVLDRFQNLAASVAAISDSSNLSDRVSIDGQDEVTMLGTAINEMLAALEQSEADNQAIIQAIPDMLLRLDGKGTILDFKATEQFPKELLYDGFVGESVSQIMQWPILELQKDVIDEGMALVNQAIETGDQQHIDFEVSLQEHRLNFDARIVPFSRIQNEVLIIIQDVTERKTLQKAEEALLLLKETHHRVKNNLQVISSLLNMQARDFSDPHVAAAFQESRNRVISMALLHEKLYDTDKTGAVDFNIYVQDLVAQLKGIYYQSIQGVNVVVDITGISLDIDSAVPCGLIINELVSNAFKYGFPQDKTGTVSVKMTQSANGLLKLIVTDDGIGMPMDLVIDEVKSLGLRLVSSLAGQLQGTLDIQREGITSFVIQFPIDQ